VLYLIGMGMEEGDLTLKGKKALEGCREVFLEGYTSVPYGLGIPVRELGRKEVESDFLLEKARGENVALMVPGDPLFATTHLALVSGCRREGVPVEIIHAPSVLDAVARTGLSPYKLGRVVTLSRPYDSDREKIAANRQAGLHTLCLLDPAIGAPEGLAVIREFGFTGQVVVCERLGTASERIRYGPAEELRRAGYGPKPHCILLPGEMQFFEKEFLEGFSPRNHP